MKSLLIQQVYPKKGFLPLIQETFKRNTDYCEKFDLDYLFISTEVLDTQNGGWEKVLQVQKQMYYYDFIVWLDADAMIFDTTRDLKSVPLPEDSIGAVKFMMPVPHFNVGALYINTGYRSRNFIEDWLGAYPGTGLWREQAVFNKMKDKITELPKEWNRNFDNSPAAKPVIMGFHGFGSAEHRLELMRHASS